MLILPTLAMSLLVVQKPSEQIDFDTQIIPVLTKAGCNTGSCHGAASGRGGFRLSLWGSDPNSDYLTIVRELKGRRINHAHPERSLFLLKPTREIEHKGGQRFSAESESAQRILSWIKDGAPRLKKRKLTEFQVTPAESLVKKIDAEVQLKCIASFDDGSKVDVTQWAVFTSTDPGAIDVDKAGLAAVLRRGQHVVLVRYLDQVVPVRITLPLGDKPVDLSKVPRHNWIDDEILKTLSTLQLPVSKQTHDFGFARRIYLDLTGTLPTPEELKKFVDDPRKDKRRRLIDQLLASTNFVDYRALKWGNLLRINSRSLGEPGVKAFHGWVREQVAKNTPLDKMAREMLLALGNSSSVGPANFSRIPSNPREHAEFVSVVLMGARMQCANCHNHPLDRWTQDDYHGLSAIFAKVERGAVVKLKSFGEVTHPRTGEAAQVRLPGDRFLKSEKTARKELADWLTDAGNPYFARSVVNRLWKEMMGHGLVEPVDDIRATNPATHPAILNRLAKEFIEHDYDSRHILRLIANSSTYQRSSRTLSGNKSDDRFYSRALIRPLEAEVLADAIAQVTGISDKYGKLPLGTRAITLADSRIPAPTLDVLGRCSRIEACEDEANAGGLATTLHLINGPLLNKKIAHPNGRLRKLLKENGSEWKVLEKLQVIAIGREFGNREIVFWDEQLSKAKNDRERRELMEDFLWSLLTSKAFTHRQ